MCTAIQIHPRPRRCELRDTSLVCNWGSGGSKSRKYLARQSTSKFRGFFSTRPEAQNARVRSRPYSGPACVFRPLAPQQWSENQEDFFSRRYDSKIIWMSFVKLLRSLRASRLSSRLIWGGKRSRIDLRFIGIFGKPRESYCGVGLRGIK